MTHRNIALPALLCAALSGCGDKSPSAPERPRVWQEHVQQTEPDKYGVVCYRMEPYYYASTSLACVKVKP